MATRATVLLGLVTVLFGTTAAAQPPSSPLVDLQRLVFGTGDPAFPDTPERMEAQLQLAAAYATGTGLSQDVELACGLAQIARHLAFAQAEGTSVDARAQQLETRLCAIVYDRAAALALATCPRFGIEPHTLQFAPGAILVVGRQGWSIEDASGVHEGEWPLNCDDIVASMRLRRISAVRGSGEAPRRFLELFIWHQSRRDDGTVGDRSLEWKALEFSAAKGELNLADSVAIVVEPRSSVWPTPPIPPSVSAGATFRMRTNGQVRWRFERAPELGTGTIDREAQ